MPSVSRNGGEEQLILSKEKARQIAENFNGGDDPYPEIPCALLSAEHIIKYAKKTGMIAPLFRGGDRARMKKASYEGRIGGKLAYKFDKDGKLVEMPVRECLTVEANSIVFVECDIQFDLPDFIAMRFNLHIRHVHRGLLLGTGPLVDPGYRGKLCIPLHNLTDKDYPIPVSKGLIWMEFTKTSEKSNEGRPPGNVGRSVRDFISQAASQYGGTPVPIRSSIPVSVELARDAKNAVNRVQWIGIGAGILVTIGIVGLTFASYQNIQSAYDSVGPQAREAHTQSVLNEHDIDAIKSKIGELEEEIEGLRKKLVDSQSSEENS